MSDFPGDYTTLNWKSCDLTRVHVSWSGTVLPRNGDGMGAYFKLNVMILCFRKEKKTSLASFDLKRTWIPSQNIHFLSRNGNRNIL